MPKWMHRRLDGDDGLSLVETIVALFIMGVILTASAAFFINSLKNSSLQSQRQTAVTVTTQAMEAAQAVKVDKLISGRSQLAVAALMATDPTREYTRDDIYGATSWDAGAPAQATATGLVPTTQVQTVNSVEYTVRTFINLCKLNRLTGACGTTDLPGAVVAYRSTVVTAWTPRGSATCPGGCRFTASTLFAEKQLDPKFNSNVSQPSILTIRPSAVLAGNSATLTITGTEFVAGATVTIEGTGGVFGQILTNTGTSITIPFTGGSTPGTYVVAVTNPDGGRAVSSIQLTAPPTITAINPNPITPGVATTVTVTGTGFVANGFGATMTAGTATVGSVSSTSATLLLTPNGSQAGPATVTVTNADGGTASAPIGLRPSTPALIQAVQTGTVNAVGQSTQVTLTGTGFFPGVSVSASTGTVTAVSYVSSTTLLVSITPSAPNVLTTFTVTNPDGGRATGAVTVRTGSAPTITAVTLTFRDPTKSNRDTYRIDGTGFTGPLTLTVTYNDNGTIRTIPLVAPVAVTPTTLGFTIDLPGKAGSYNNQTTFTVLNGNGQTVATTVQISS